MTSPYLEREDVLARMSRLLRLVTDLTDARQRALAYCAGRVTDADILLYDEHAAALETLRRTLFDKPIKKPALSIDEALEGYGKFTRKWINSFVEEARNENAGRSMGGTKGTHREVETGWPSCRIA